MNILAIDDFALGQVIVLVLAVILLLASTQLPKIARGLGVDVSEKVVKQDQWMCLIAIGIVLTMIVVRFLLGKR